MLGGDAHPAPADGVGHGLYRVVLPHDVGPEALIQLGQTLKLLLLDGGGGNFGPQFDDSCQMGNGQRGVSLGGENVPLSGELGLPAFQLGQALIGLFIGGGLHRLLFGGDGAQLFLKLGNLLAAARLPLLEGGVVPVGGLGVVPVHRHF